MAQNTEQQKIWTAARQGWKVSIIVGLAVLLIRFKALIPLVWQILVTGGTVDAIGDVLKDLLLIAVIIGGGALLVYAVRAGYRRTSQALELNNNSLNTSGGNPSNSSLVLRIIGRVSLFINAPILYWALFLFVLLPQLIKIPNASLRIGTTAALAGAFISMAVIVVLATHIGLLLTKFSLKSIRMAPELAVPPFNTGVVVGADSQPLPYAEQGSYAAPGGYPPNPQMPPVNNQLSYYGQQVVYPSNPSPANPNPEETLNNRRSWR